MTIVSVGYPRTVGENLPYVNIMSLIAGHQYFVWDAATAKITPVAAGTRQVQMSTGDVGGQGVHDKITAAEVLTLGAPSSGTKWWMVGLLRTWGADSASSSTVLTAIDAGTVTPTTLPARPSNRGVSDFQPLALVPVTFGQTIPGTPIDLRAIGHARGYYVATSELVLQYMNYVGYQIRIGTTTWRRLFNPAGSAVWDKDPGAFGRVTSPEKFGPDVLVTSPGWVATTPSGTTSRLIVLGNTVQYDVQVRRNGGTLSAADSSGNFVDSPIATMQGPRPEFRVPVMFENGFYGHLDTQNMLVLAGGRTGATVPQRIDDNTAVSLRCCIRFTVAAAS